MKTPIEEAVSYFKNQPIFLEVFNGLIDKYATYERFTGTLNKSDLHAIEPLLTFLGINQTAWQRSTRFKLETFVAAYQRSKFAGVDLKALLADVTGRKLVTNRAIAAQAERHAQAYLQAVQKGAPHLYSLLGANNLNGFFREDIALAAFQQVERLWLDRPNEPIRLPVIAYRFTHDPHGLDRDQPAGKVLAACLKTSYPNVDFAIERYLMINIVRDDILNFVTVQNISATDRLFQDAAHNHLIWNVPLMALLRLKRVKPAVGNKIFIIENSSVFAILAARFPEIPMIMTGGQFKYATWKFLELFDEHVQFFYGSDLDPAGLVMAARLLAKYPQRVHLLGMSVDVYRSHLGDGKKLTDPKLRVLNGLEAPNLTALKMVIGQAKKAVYQEAVLSELLTEIRTQQGD